LRAGADTSVNLGEHEIHGLIHKVKYRALENPVRRDRLSNFSAMKVKTLDLRGREKTLWLHSEEKNSCVCGLPIFKQIEVGKGFLPRGLGWQWIIPLALSDFQE